MRALLLVLLIASCSGERQIIVNPEPKTLEEGASAGFVLDSEKSSKFVTAGELEITLVELTDETATFKALVDLDTKFGPQKVEIEQKVGADILSLEFLGKLRAEMDYEGDGFKLRYQTMTLEACDVFKIYEMKQYKGVEIEATLCVSSGKIPNIKVNVDMYGIPVTLVMVQST